jgi:hypothetical protein
MIDTMSRSELGVSVWYFDSAGDTPEDRVQPLTSEVWDKYVSEEHFWTIPHRIMFNFKNPDALGLPSRERDNFETTVICSLKLNRIDHFTIQSTDVYRSDELNSEDIYWAIWYVLFHDYNWDAPNLLIKKQVRTYEKGYEYFTKSNKPLAPILTNENLEELGITNKELNQTLLACEYLNFVDFFNGSETLNWLSVAPVFENSKSYKKFLDNVVDEEDRKPDHYELAQKRKRTMKTYVNRIDPKIMVRWGTGIMGGKLTDRALEVLTKYLVATNQPVELLDSVRLEVKITRTQ